MGFSLGGIVSGIRDRAEDVVQKGEDFAQHVVDGAKDKVVDKGTEFAGKVVDFGLGLIPRSVESKILGGAETVVDGAAEVVTHVPGLPKPVTKLAGDLSRVDLQAAVDYGPHKNYPKLEGDWGKLYPVWMFEQRPDSLGEWDLGVKDEDGSVYDVVTITDTQYTKDLATRQHQTEFTKKLFEGGVYEGKSLTAQWQYTGPGAANDDKYTYKMEADNGDKFEDTDGDGIHDPGEKYLASGGHYGALETYVGSYDTTMEVKSIDPATGNVTVKYTVVNDSVWESGTRVNPSGQGAGLPDALIPNQDPNSGAHLGGNFRQIYVWEQTFTPGGTPVGDVSPPTS